MEYNGSVNETPRKLELRCPECQAEVVVDADSGHVLYHRKAQAPLAGGKDFESLMASEKEGRSKAEKVFEREKAALKDRERLLEERFREAMERASADEDDGPPKRPFDFD